jgi:hypothetical protein
MQGSGYCPGHQSTQATLSLVLPGTTHICQERAAACEFFYSVLGTEPRILHTLGENWLKKKIYISYRAWWFTPIIQATPEAKM